VLKRMNANESSIAASRTIPARWPSSLNEAPVSIEMSSPAMRIR
jgi:hypothetical protein